MKLDYSSNAAPLYHQIKEFLIDKIKNNKYKVGDTLPSELVLIKSFKVSRVTVRKAFDELLKEGYIKKQRGKGAIVIQNKIKTPSSKIGDYLETLNLDPWDRRKMIGIEVVKSSSKISDMMNLERGQEVKRIGITIYSVQTPVSYSETYLLNEIKIPNDYKEFIGELHDILENYNDIIISKIKDYIKIVKANKTISDILKIEENSQVIKKTRISYDDNERVFECTISYTRCDRWELTVEVLPQLKI